EPAGVPHLAHVTEHLTVFDLPPGSDEARAVARWSAQGKANGETLADFMYFDLHVPSAELATALRVQAGRLTGGHFSKDTLARERVREGEAGARDPTPLGGDRLRREIPGCRSGQIRARAFCPGGFSRPAGRPAAAEDARHHRRTSPSVPPPHLSPRPCHPGC